MPRRPVPAGPPSAARGAVAAALALVLALVAAACSGPSGGADPRERGTVPFRGCDEVDCTGEIGGARYEVRLPERWNGTLLLYSHGYRHARPAPPDFAPVSTAPQVASTAEAARELLAEGYALAGSSYSRNGWAVREGVQAGEDLYAWFAEEVGRPERVYLWGDSLGGLITATLAEEHPEWVSGAAPMCGVLAGLTLNFDVALDLAYTVRALLYPEMRLTGYRSHEDAVSTFTEAQRRVLAATRDLRTGVPRLLLAGAVVDGPAQTARFDGSTPTSRLSATVEAVLTGLAFATVARYEVEQRVGGNPSGNVGVDYAARVSDAERAQVEAVRPGATAAALALLGAGRRVEPDARARAAADRLGNPTGVLKDPTITLHTTADPLVLVQNERVFADRVAAREGRQADLVQLYTVAPPRFSPPAPYGAGHCAFTTRERVGLVRLLDGWVRGGVRPTSATAAAAFGADSGLSPGYEPGPWPREGAR